MRSPTLKQIETVKNNVAGLGAQLLLHLLQLVLQVVLLALPLVLTTRDLVPLGQDALRQLLVRRVRPVQLLLELLVPRWVLHRLRVRLVAVAPLFAQRVLQRPLLLHEPLGARLAARLH